MRVTSRRPVGWRGQSYEHSLTARGVRLYPAKKRLVDPVFLARKEQEVPYGEVSSDICAGMTYQQIVERYPGASKEEIRRKAIKAYEAKEADGTLSYMDRHGVEHLVRMAKLQPELKEKMQRVLSCSQGRSLMHQAKVDALRKQLS